MSQNLEKCRWLFESDKLGDDSDRLMAAVRRQGMEAKMASTVALRAGDDWTKCYPPQSCVVFYGTQEFALHVTAKTDWFPAAFTDTEAFQCSDYYSHFGRFHIASAYAMVPFGDLRRVHEELFNRFGIQDTLFIRPNSDMKLFKGQLIHRETFEKQMGQLGFYDPKPEDLVVVSEPRNVVDEWRLVIADRRVITSSSYRIGGQIHRQEGCPPEAMNIGEAVADVKWQPDRIYVADVFRTAAGNFYLGEVGALSTCGIYACDVVPIVAEASRIAEEQWYELHMTGHVPE